MSEIARIAVTGAVVSAQPGIFLLGVNGSDEVMISLASVPGFLDTQERYFIFFNPMRAFSFDGYRTNVLAAINTAKARYSQHNYTILVNDDSELALIRNLVDPEIHIYVCGEHALTDVNKFTYTANDIVYDALYIAQMHPVKRVQLASKVSRLCLISRDITPAINSDFQSRFDQFFSPNMLTGTFVRQSAEDINKYMSQSACGLILSEKEGQNRATIEYLLCGLPVVTTPSLGGRDRFLHPGNSVIVEPTAETVADGVQFVKETGFDRRAIADAARVSILRERKWLEHIINRELHQFGCAPIDLMTCSLPHHGFSHAEHVATHMHAINRPMTF